jgi:cephalosporin hydroxylase
MENRDIFDQYHSWYYDTNVWKKTTFLGVRCLKSVSDMWNYQEILSEIKPALLIEVGTFHGGSALFFSSVLRQITPYSKVVSIDISHKAVADRVREDNHIELITGRLTDEKTLSRIRELRKTFRGPVFAILDSDHPKNNVLAEMNVLRPILTPGDYLVVEDGNINGHPVLPGWGEGPMEAIQEYFTLYPGDYRADTQRENKFGFTFAPRGFLIRQ